MAAGSLIDRGLEHHRCPVQLGVGHQALQREHGARGVAEQFHPATQGSGQGGNVAGLIAHAPTKRVTQLGAVEAPDESHHPAPIGQVVDRRLPAAAEVVDAAGQQNQRRTVAGDGRPHLDAVGGGAGQLGRDRRLHTCHEVTVDPSRP